MISSKKGYSISIIHNARDSLYVRAWGVWEIEDRTLAKNFERELKEKVKEISVNGKEWTVCEDLIDFRAQSKEVCRILGDGIVFAIKHGMKRAGPLTWHEAISAAAGTVDG
jgi:hypothetical protein